MGDPQNPLDRYIRELPEFTDEPADDDQLPFWDSSEATDPERSKRWPWSRVVVVLRTIVAAGIRAMVPAWSRNPTPPAATGAALSSDLPERPTDNMGSAGVANDVSRRDHRHPLPRHATRSAGGIASAGDKQQIDKITDLEHRAADLEVAAHDDWVDLPNGNAAAFRMAGINQSETLASSSWGHRHQALLTNINYVVEMRIPRAEELAQYRLSVDDALVAPNVWSEGEPDTNYRYFGGVGTITVARNKFVAMQRSTRSYHTTYQGDVPTTPARDDQPASKAYVDRNAGSAEAQRTADYARRLAESNHESVADVARVGVFSWALATEEEGGMAFSADAALDAAGAAALAYASTFEFTAGTDPVNLYVRRDKDAGDTPSDFRVYANQDQRPTLGTGVFAELGAVGEYVYYRFVLDIANLLPLRVTAGTDVPLRFEYHGSTRHTRWDGGLGGTAIQEVQRAARDRYTDAEKAKLAHLDSTGATVVQALAAAAAVTWDVEAGTVADLTLTRNVTLQLSGGSDGDTALLRVVQDSTGGRTLALHASTARGGRTAPVVANGANERSYLLFHRVGTTWVWLGMIEDE